MYELSPRSFFPKIAEKLQIAAVSSSSSSPIIKNRDYSFNFQGVSKMDITVFKEMPAGLALTYPPGPKTASLKGKQYPPWN